KSDSKPEPPAEAKPSPTVEPAPLPSSRLVNDPQEPKSNDVGTATGATFTAVSGTLELAEEPEVEEVLPPPSAPAPAESAAAPVQRDYEVITSDSLPAVGSKEFDEILAKAQKASEEPQNTNVVQQAVTAQIHLPTSFRTSSDKLPVVSAGLTNELPIAKAAALARQTLEMDTSALAVADTSGAANPFITSGDGEPAATASVATAPLPTKDSSSAWAAAVRDEPKPQSSAATEDNAEKRLFDIVRTDPLPIVAIDIERLFQTSFHVSPYGHVSLGNDVLDSDLQKILQDFKQGKNFITVATEEQMQPAQVLHHCKFCLERGYIDPPDAVASLTADLLLGRVELEQYLLQRRRITGDELRDVMEVSKQKGIKLTDLLVKLGFMTASDWDRLCQEKERFARR
ncbi:MAG: hypothetical protein JSS83_23935, partial [Cyanobacteria bacterium SZAS LIN-3]|nr:hypothetical protein [Cyanobacteria bacterium SZAS LIN-3]